MDGRFRKACCKYASKPALVDGIQVEGDMFRFETKVCSKFSFDWQEIRRKFERGEGAK